MKDVTGKDIVTNMMRLATEMSSWNKAYATEDKAAKRMEELGLTRHQLDVIGFLYTNPELDTESALSAAAACQQGQSVLNAFQAGGRRLCAEKSGEGWR